MLSSRAWSSSLCIPAALGCGPCPQPDPNHGHDLILCLAAAGHSPTVGTQHQPLLAFHFILSIFFNSSFLDSSCLYFSTMAIASSQLNQPSAAFLLSTSTAIVKPSDSLTHKKSSHKTFYFPHSQISCFNCTFATARTFSIVLSFFPLHSACPWSPSFVMAFFCSFSLWTTLCVSETWILIPSNREIFPPCSKPLCR